MLELVFVNGRKSLHPVRRFTKEDVFALRSQMYGQVCQILRKHPNKDMDADDIVQDATIRAVRALPNFRGDSGLDSWVYQIVYRITIDYLRRCHRRPLANSMPLIEEALSPVNHTEERLVARLDMRKIDAALATLPPEQSRVFILKRIKELTFSEIATAEGIPLSTAKTRCGMATQRLRWMLRGAF